MKKVILILIIFTTLNVNIVSANQETLKVGMECDYAPHNWTTTKEEASEHAVPLANANGYCDGYDVMMATQIADIMGVNLEVYKITWDGLIPSLESGQIDAIVAGMSPTEERKEQIDFTDSYYTDNTNHHVIVNKDSEYVNATNLQELSGSSITAQLGTLQEGYLGQIPERENIAPMDNYSSLMQATQSNTIDGYIAEEDVAAEQAEASDSLKVIELVNNENGFTVSEADVSSAIGIKKGNTQLKNEINESLESIGNSSRTQMMDIAKVNAGMTEINGMFGLFNTYTPMFIQGIKVTLLLALLGTFFGTILGALIAALKTQKVHYKDTKSTKVIKKISFIIASIYIDIVRGTPMIVQASLFYYGLVSNIMSPNIAGVIIISLNTAAYMAEIIRGGIESIDKGQLEAARSLGISSTNAMIRVVIPQAMKNTFPALINELVVNVKDSSVLSVIQVTELFYSAKAAASATYMTTEAYLIAALIYFILTTLLSRGLAYLFLRKRTVKHSFPSSQTTKEVI